MNHRVLMMLRLVAFKMLFSSQNKQKFEFTHAKVILKERKLFPLFLHRWFFAAIEYIFEYITCLLYIDELLIVSEPNSKEKKNFKCVVEKKIF